MPDLINRLARLERRVHASGPGCPRCFNGGLIILREPGEPVPPPCPRCGSEGPVMRIPRVLPPHDWDTALKLAGLGRNP